MKLDMENLRREIAARSLPQPTDQQVAQRATGCILALRRYGYADTPASPTIAAHMARLALAKPRDGSAPQFGGPRKGLALLGTIGTGKTTALRIIAAGYGAEYVDAATMARNYAAYGEQWLAEREAEWRAGDLILDDLGTATEVAARSFGQPVPVGDVIAARYDLWMQSGKRLYVSSNLSREDLIARYGERVVDRLAEMCEPVPCVGSSFRRSQNVTR